MKIYLNENLLKVNLLNNFSKIILSIFIGIILMYFTSKNILWNELFVAFKSFNYFLFIPSICILITMYFLHSLRWKILLDGSFVNYRLIIFAISNIGFMFNSVLPFRIGDFVKIYLAKKNINPKISKITSTIIIGHYFDFIFLFILLNILLLIINIDINEIFVNKYIYYIFFLIIAIITISLILINDLLRVFSYTLNRIHYFKGSIKFIFNLNLEIKNIVRNYKKLLITIGLTIFYWILLVFLFKIISMGFGLNLHLSSYILAVVLSALIISVPITPISIGTFHLAVIYAFSFWVSDETLIFAYSIFLHSLIMLTTIIIGIMSLLYLQFINKSNTNYFYE